MMSKEDEVLDRLERIEAAMQAPTREYLSTDEAAKFLHLSPRQLAQWRVEGQGPAYHSVGRKILYSQYDLVAFMDTLRHVSNAPVS